MPKHTIISSIRPSLLFLLMCIVVCGLIYPFSVMLLAKTVWSHEGEGSLIVRDGKVVGSELIGQHFIMPKYFHGRPSATEPPYNAAASTGSPNTPLDAAYRVEIIQRMIALQGENPDADRDIPADLLLVSASGLDPHISVEAALYQVPRVAKARKMKRDEVEALVTEHTEEKLWGLLGHDQVNVLKLNLVLDEK